MVYAWPRSARQARSRVWAAMVAAARVSRRQKVWGAWRASPSRSVILPKLASIRLRHSGDNLLQDGGHLLAVTFGGRDQDGGAAGGLLRGERLAVEPLVREQVARRWPGFQQVLRDVALAGRGGHDAPGPHDAAAQVGLDRQPEPVEPFGVRGVTAEPGGQVVPRAGPLVRAADPGGVLDRQPRRVDLLAVVCGKPGRQRRAQLLERAPQPADPAGGPPLAPQARGTGPPSP